MNMQIYKRTGWIKFLTLFFLGYYSSLKKIILVLLINHWILVFFSISLFLTFHFDNYLSTGNNTIDAWKSFLFDTRVFLCLGITLTASIKLFYPYILFFCKANITDKFKKYIWIEQLINPFGLLFTLYKLLSGPVFFYERKKPDFVLEKKDNFFDKKSFPKENQKHMLKISNLNFWYHNNNGINKYSHLIMKKMSDSIYEKHMSKKNNHLNCENCLCAEDDFAVLKNINLNLENSQFISVLGCNGSGKTTLIKIINNFFPHYEGSIFWYGKNQKEISIKNFAKNVAYVPQTYKPHNNITIYDFVCDGLFPNKHKFKNNKALAEQIVEKNLKDLNLFEIKNTFLSHLSGGIKQKAIIARALIQNAKIIILDEPTTYLDIHSQYLVLNLFKELQKKQKITIIAILHNLQQAKNYSDFVILLKNGSIFKSGNVKEVMTENNIKRVFGGKN